MIPIRMRLSFWGLAGALGFAAAVISLAGFLGAWTWWLEILSHFRVQYALCFLLLALAYAAGGKWRGFVGALSLALINAAPVFLFLWPPAAPAPPNQTVFRAMLLNVNCRRGEPAAVRATIASAHPDFLVLEEISPRWLVELAPALAEYPFRKIQARHDNFGIGLFSRQPFDAARIEPFGIVDVPSVFADLTLAGRRLTLVATHPLPPGGALLAAERNRQLEWIARKIASVPGPVLLLGDLNTSPWSPAYRRVLATSGLADAAQGRSIRPTWPSFLPPLWIPLDHVLHSDEIAVHAFAVGPHVGSDHLPLVVDFSCAPRP